MNVLGLVLARGGSVRVPRKNLKPLGGVPLLAWTVTAARYARTLDRLVISSDDDEILHVGRQYGAEPLKRPPELAADDTPSYPPMFHALDALDQAFSHLCLLQPTSPLRATFDIDGCVDKALTEEDGRGCVSVEFDKEIPNGAVYVGRVDWLRDAWARWPGLPTPRPFDDPSLPRWLMPSWRSVDIDTPEDFARAESIVEGTAA